LDLYGISYGTYLGLTVMRDHPEVVRSSILSSPLPLEANVFSGQVIGLSDALQGVFDACNNDPECVAAFPNIEDDFEKVIVDLSAEPLVVDITDPVSGEVIPFPVDAPTFAQLLYLSVFIGPLIEAVVPLIGVTAAGDPTALEQILPIILTPAGSSGTSTGVLYTLFCNDEAPYTSDEEVASEVEDADMLPEVADESIFAGLSATTFDICSAWGIDTGPGTQNDPVRSDIPTLFVTGQFDPIIPPEYGEILESELSNSFLVNFENQGHDPLTNVGECGLTVIDTFLEDPATGPDTACVDEQVLDLTPDEPASPEATPAS
ncbi:MAG: alpha/beta hydrolase, partial [Thermomicrobiales bacterium]